MSEFDFDALERELQAVTAAETLVERAAVAWLEEERSITRNLLVVAAETLDDILDASNAEDPKVKLGSDRSKPNDGEVQVQIESMRFKVDIRYSKDDPEELIEAALYVHADRAPNWRRIRNLQDLGRHLAESPPPQIKKGSE